MGKSLYEKVFERHAVQQLPSGQYQLLMGLHLIHEVTSPQAFAMLRERGLGVQYPQRTFATVDHIIPTHDQRRPLADELAEEMLDHLEHNCAEHGITFFGPDSGEQGIVHIIGPEKGLTQPGMTVCCGDSHTATHGAFGALAFGIGTSQVADVLATQTLAMDKLKVRRIEVNGTLSPGVYAKDVILHLIGKLGVKGGVGYAYEYGGNVFDGFSMEERLTVCNMSIEGGARCGYVNPDQTTYDFLKGRDYAPKDGAWDQAVAYWESVKSDPDAAYDDVVQINAEDIEPVVTWGINPGQSTSVGGVIPAPDDFPADDQGSVKEALEHMSFAPGTPIKGTKIDVAFIGSCTNGNLSDFAEVAKLLEGRNLKVAAHVRTLVVPGSQRVHQQMKERGYDKLFEQAGFDVRLAGCSMCLAMNPDKLQGREISASTSNRNFKGRQGSPTGRTLLMSPAMVAAAAIAGKVVDARELFDLK
ncbi:MAG: 3-isopropylmalate dehydratase large subunit [Armatimonadetes bacterium CG_4_10_14_3_um_filter_66_18]|nr:3-isopropylmalate dehydratase large subunit [Armatimonadota bacterium]OIO99203.1 MAG: 3-isopropylmalate dehydratase large subunit [Armatimonadetes bacterium CG2_30_66_41]PIX45623.1 MAG: 3-isopropylmalate dehydratase large subunit [Armatimonadetes bacterium CG_4_8_14_3_um_filter_66_20]PIY44691.1 MAG: 3-isopropylmalate dehydratase large subunit [Armatimonadetes bacterium CG_4_10_14_3_um_filter_66_18]PIZ29914.1 MAG: 3-isopropylmalate dehydratase large subunit [Armatimonadetes bacterium CG_4_10_